MTEEIEVTPEVTENPEIAEVEEAPAESEEVTE